MTERIQPSERRTCHTHLTNPHTFKLLNRPAVIVYVGRRWPKLLKLLRHFVGCVQEDGFTSMSHPFGGLRGDKPSDCRKCEDRLKTRPRQRQQRLAARTCRAAAAKNCSSGVSCGMTKAKPSESVENLTEGLRLLACENFWVRRMATGRLPGSRMPSPALARLNLPQPPLTLV